MSAPVEPFIFSQIGLDSGSLTMLGAIVHPLFEPGEYRGLATRAGGDSQVFLLTVDEKRPAVQVDVDLATLVERGAVRPCGCGADHGGMAHFVVGGRAHVVFHVSGGPGGFSVHLTRAEEGPRAKAFDSTRLGEGDIFAATILRPGVYSVVNAAAGAEAAPGSIEVAYPEIGKTPHRPPDPVRVECGRGGFVPSSLRLTAMQGCAFLCRVPSRIVIRLERPQEPPAPARPGS